jgi:hypothetical protein
MCRAENDDDRRLSVNRIASSGRFLDFDSSVDCGCGLVGQPGDRFIADAYGSGALALVHPEVRQPHGPVPGLRRLPRCEDHETKIVGSVQGRKLDD